MGLAIRAVIGTLWRVPDDVDIVAAWKWLRAIGVCTAIYAVDRVARLVLTHQV